MLDWLLRLLFGVTDGSGSSGSGSRSRRRRREKVRLTRWRGYLARSAYRKGRDKARWVKTRPYRFAVATVDTRLFVRHPGTGETVGDPSRRDLIFHDRSGDGDTARLARFGLPAVSTPDELADLLGVGLGRLAWLTHRTDPKFRPVSAAESHYTYRFVPKKSGGLRLIEAPKPLLKSVQRTLLAEMLDRVPPHPAAHGFRYGRSIVTNAEPHVGAEVVVSLDIANFYPSVRQRRVNAIFRSVGYPGEVAIWLTRLATSVVPPDVVLPEGRGASVVRGYWNLGRHLPQGAPTSPAIANLACYGLDVRLAGLARSFGGTYTRYADDLTFSGDHHFLRSLKAFIPLAQEVIRHEGFVVQAAKRRVQRQGGRLAVTGVVVNEKVNVCRADYDRLKAILHNCVRHGPASQNRGGIDDFAAHLRGRVAHVARLNRQKGEKLLREFRKIDWTR
ncbi:MAG: reverse transcriptase family protein [Planctomycetota bacterium]